MLLSGNVRRLFRFLVEPEKRDVVASDPVTSPDLVPITFPSSNVEIFVESIMPSFPARCFSKVSRAIGDIYLKFLEFSNLYKQFGSSDSLLKAVITAEASISVRKLERDDLFFILASNGVWEQLGDQTAVDNNVHEPGSGFAKRLAIAAMQEAAKKRGLRYEDMSLFEEGLRRQKHDLVFICSNRCLSI